VQKLTLLGIFTQNQLDTAGLKL